MDSKDNTLLSSDELRTIYEELDAQVPNDSIIDVTPQKPYVDKVEEYNRKLINAYIKGETFHLKGQKPVGIIIAIAVGLQLIAFNVLIYIVALSNYDFETLKIILDFMKYYVGAVVVEMLGLCLIVVRGVFSMSIGKVVKQILANKKSS